MRACIFTSAGDKERFATFCSESLREYDVIINYYGDDEERRERLMKSSKKVVSLKTTKFIALKQIYDSEIRGRYDWVAVFDDDARFVEGSMGDLLGAGERFSLDIVSGSHVGKVSHPIVHKRVAGDHRIRYVNFIEMNFPVFRETALSKYMDAYDGKLCGWGNDWWYCNVLGTDSNKNAGIVDSVSIENPPANLEMERFMGWKSRMFQWEETKSRLGLKEWEMDTVGF